ncbi:MAG: radical SAM family heme chaperone HemW [Lachnospiraceae bacterium]|nr:radical SAM family heme chaperone HemW [Lachnospiraceae bacterium]
MIDTDLMLYVHIPFCVRKCAYCDFLSAPAGDAVREQYVEELCREIADYKGKAGHRPVSSVFFGGGTPSLLTGEQMSRILDTIRNCFTLTEDAEISMEMNPGTVTMENLVQYKAAGVGRISIGLQSMQEEELSLLGRIHDAHTFLECYEMARKAGFSNINVDLMMGLPGQKREALADTLKKVTDLSPEHISLYSLILEEHTPLYETYADSDKLLSQEEDRALYHMAVAMLEEKGYHQYEISNFAKEGFFCRHNEGYWRRRPYLSFGIGAASFFEEVRWNNTSSLSDYLAGDHAPADQEILTLKDAMEEFMFLGLRTTAGICRETFEEAFEEDYETVYGEVTRKLIAQGLLQEREEGGKHFVSCTGEGLDLNNLVGGAFLLEDGE